jgi:beta-lactamase superfamily II metal-dependent hydrolase
MIKINMLQAGSGDCFLVQVEPDTDNEINILIDCGYNYQKGIEPHLKRIISKGKKIDRFIITHYDADHIQGALSLIKENGKAASTNLFPIEQVWLNTFRHLQFYKREETKNSNVEEVVKDLINLDKKVNEVDVIGDKSARQASLLGNELYANGYKWNTDFNNLAVSPENRKVVKLSEDLSIELLTPSFSRLETLENDFIEYLKTKGLTPTDDELFDDAFELYCKTKNKHKTSLIGDKSGSSKVISSDSIKHFSKGENYKADTAIENGSSISFILHYKGKKVLFTGDAFAEDIENALLKAYPNNEEHPIIFDAIKMPHHGSYNNCNPSLLKLIDSNNYLFSTSGASHNHPDIETISCVINRELQPEVNKRNLYFNYTLSHISEFKNEEFQKEFNYLYEQKGIIEVC